MLVSVADQPLAACRPSPGCSFARAAWACRRLLVEHPPSRALPRARAPPEGPTACAGAPSWGQARAPRPARGRAPAATASASQRAPRPYPSAERTWGCEAPPAGAGLGTGAAQRDREASEPFLAQLASNLPAEPATAGGRAPAPPV